MSEAGDISQEACLPAVEGDMRDLSNSEWEVRVESG